MPVFGGVDSLHIIVVEITLILFGVHDRNKIPIFASIAA